MLQALITICLGAVGWVGVSFLGRPILRFFELRQQIERARINAIRTPVPLDLLRYDDGVVGRPNPGLDALDRAKADLRKGGVDMLAFGRAEPTAVVLRWIGYDAIRIGEAAAALANYLDEGINPRVARDKELREVLRVK